MCTSSQEEAYRFVRSGSDALFSSFRVGLRREMGYKCLSLAR